MTDQNADEKKEILPALRIKREPYRIFNLAFALMTVIPFLVFLYLLATEFFSLEIFIGDVAFVLLSSFFLALSGYCLGYSILRNSFEKVVSYAEETKKAYAQLKGTQAMLVHAEKFKAIGQLASSIAHEVKNPLGILLQDIVYLEENVAAEKDVPKVLAMMKKNIERADEIIRGLLDFSRISEIDIKPQEINKVIENALVLVHHRVELEHIKFVKELADGLPLVLADSIKMEQAFVNLLLNSIQAMPNGGTLTIRSHKLELDKAGKGIGRRADDIFELGETAVEVEIEDTGIGMSEETLGRIFEPFFTSKETARGTGLGLAVTRNIIDLHKGLMDIKSKQAQGTKVTLTLKTTAAEIKEPQRAGAVNVNRKRIIIVDDEQDFLDIVKLNLEATQKYEVMTLSAPKDIISKVHDFKPDVILLDILLPGIDGLQACEMLNRDPAGKDIPVIILSALDTDSDKLRAYKLGVVDYITKPVKKETLIAKIEKALQFK